MSELQDADPMMDEPTAALPADPRQSEFAEPGGWPELPRTRGSYREALPGQVVMIPALGLDHHLFWPQQRAYGQAIVSPNWLEPRPNEALSDYARRWAEQLKNQVDPDQPLFLGGASIGGMMALEMAEVLNPRATFLIGSCINHHELPLRAQLLTALAGRVPEPLLKLKLPWWAVALACREQLDDTSFALVRRMMGQAEPGFFKWAAMAMHDWDFEGPLSDNQKPVYRIHGRWDWLLPPQPGTQFDKLIPDGRHLINLSHPRTVNTFISDHCWAHVTEADNPGPRYRYY
jgi:pimeloyl-ACP methyl ester carboxylesterase